MEYELKVQGEQRIPLDGEAALICGLYRTSGDKGTPKAIGADADGNLLTNIRALDSTLDTVASGSKADLFTFAADTNILASGDVIALALEITNAVPVNEGQGLLNSLVLYDLDAQSQAIDLYFFSATVSAGAANAAFSVGTANTTKLLGKVSIVAADYEDIGDDTVARVEDLGVMLKAAAASRSVFVIPVCRSGTPTYTASGLSIRPGILW